jgi:alpha-1,3-mannosyl-glycoprotein beta-1,2-N-acetylglucosaminyltransferase
MDMVRHSRRAPSIEEGLEIISSGTSNVVVPYAGFADFQDMARQLGLMDDEKAGVPRTGYKGVVESRKNDHFLFLAPIDVI